VTVAADDRTFYATLASGGLNWLVRGDLVERTVQSVRQNAECPSLSPDGTRVAYKKRPSLVKPWELVVLDLKTNKERVLPGTVGIDDQAVWLDDGTLAYGAVLNGAKNAIYFVSADGSAPAREAIANAASPVPVR
jgi:Tol biopolymer transport system component